MESLQPLVSIGVPVYNGAKYLEECLDSILAQTYSNWKCVIIDNCSKDDTYIIAEKYVATDKRFQLIKNKEFVDQTTNWNISYAHIDQQSKYFKILCADDWIFPEHLEKMVEVMEKYPSIGICTSYRIDEKKVRGDALNIYDGSFFSGKKMLIDHLYYRYDVTGGITNVLLRNDVLKKTIGYPQIFILGTYHIDTELAYEVLSMSDLGFVFQVLSYIRRHNETYTSQITERFKTKLYFREKELFKYMSLDPGFPKEYQKVRNEYAFFLLKQKIKGDKESFSWHMKYFDKSRHFTPSEYIIAFGKRFMSKFLLKKWRTNLGI